MHRRLHHHIAAHHNVASTHATAWPTPSFHWCLPLRPPSVPSCRRLLPQVAAHATASPPAPPCPRPSPPRAPSVLQPTARATASLPLAIMGSVHALASIAATVSPPTATAASVSWLVHCSRPCPHHHHLHLHLPHRLGHRATPPSPLATASGLHPSSALPPPWHCPARPSPLPLSRPRHRRISRHLTRDDEDNILLFFSNC